MKLTNRELEVMKILWESEEPLMISEVVQKEKKSTVYSVQRVMQNLLKKNAVAIDGIGYNKKALARRFCPIISPESVELNALQEMLDDLRNKNNQTASLIASLLPAENDERTLAELDALEKIITERKQQIINNNIENK